jgi:hypothetical protein
VKRRKPSPKAKARRKSTPSGKPSGHKFTPKQLEAVRIFSRDPVGALMRVAFLPLARYESQARQRVLEVPRIPPARERPAIESAASPLSWLFAEVARRKDAGDIPSSATLFAKQLAQQMAADVQAGKCRRAISAGSIRARLYEKKLWPK